MVTAVISGGGLVSIVSAVPALAQALQPAVRDAFLADPLSDIPRDPLLPSPPVLRPLSPLERFVLEQELDQLALEAESLAQSGAADAAIDPWMREIRLRRLLGLDAELTAMDRVDQNLRNLNATQALQLLSARLAVIQPSLEIPNPADRDRLEAEGA
ncbi:MAG TPA: hypothetical protein IGR64_03580 [Leptolyngbyaceae cyanobacterium M65_K2018_010]|nr:hypothetical protein [Leptolyngbyaceae cyanobacterium M65_K2018_010]